MKKSRSNTWIGDCEGDGLLDSLTKIHCIILRNFDVDTKSKDSVEKIAFVPREYIEVIKPDYSKVFSVDEFPSWVKKEKPYLIFHYGEGYDYPAFKKVFNFEVPEEKRNDSLVLARMDDPSRDNSIDGWGRYFGIPKPKHEDWSRFTLEMLHRCDQDTLIGWKLVRHLLANTLVGKCSKKSRQCELEVHRELLQVKRDGFYLDRVKATALMRETQEKADEIEKKLKLVFPPLPKPISTVETRITKNGELHSVSARQLKEANTKYPASPTNDVVRFTRFEWKEFKPGSPQDRVARLQRLGWEHTQLTKGGQPSFTEDSVVEALHRNEPWYPSAKILLDWIFLDNRARTARDWLDRADLDGYVHHTIHGIGTRTARGSHTDPNLGNITKYKVSKIIKPTKDELLEEIKNLGFDTDKDFIQCNIKEKNKEWVGEVPVKGFDGKYGFECRDCWSIKDTTNNVLIGVDAKSMQLCGLAHYSNDEEYIKRITTEDPHIVHAEALGLISNPNGRSIAKTFIYAWLLGAGFVKQGIILSEDKISDRNLLREMGVEANENFVKSYPFIEEIQKQCRRDYRRGYVEGIDGRLINIDYLRIAKQPHKVLSVYLQSYEAIIMKHAMLLWMKQLRDAGIWFRLRNWVHDEYQVETVKERADEVKKIIEEALTTVGELLHSKCPVVGEGKIGLTWAETH
jgi:DNA polymerase I